MSGVGPNCPVFTEWCRPPWGSPVPNAGQWSGYSPAGCEVCRAVLRDESSALDIAKIRSH